MKRVKNRKNLHASLIAIYNPGIVARKLKILDGPSCDDYFDTVHENLTKAVYETDQ
jgi:hypothetical protein